MELSKVTAIVRTSTLETVEKRLQELSVPGISVTKVMLAFQSPAVVNPIKEFVFISAAFRVSGVSSLKKPLTITETVSRWDACLILYFVGE